MSDSIIVWLRRDLRLADQPALHTASESGAEVIPLFIWSPEEDGHWAPGAAMRWWLDRNLRELEDQIDSIGSRLIIRQGPAIEVLSVILEETGAGSVFWNRQYEPLAIERDTSIKQHLSERGIEVRSFNGALLYEPWTIQTGQGGPYKVYTPFSKACQAVGDPEPSLPGVDTLKTPAHWPDSLSVDDLGLLPTVDWAAGMSEAWSPGERAADRLLEDFVDEAIGAYADQRDAPSVPGTSRLSPYLHLGIISPRQIYERVVSRTRSNAGWPYLRQLLWREFAHHLLYHFPTTTDQPLQEKFRRFPWRQDPEHLKAWQRGKTGIPIVDAGMRELWHTGWMHNRLRMIVGSLLVKHLLISWQEGAAWFWDTLIDADLANNTLGWQWIGGCGADAAPYFRIFNPILQGEKFDREGGYTRRWVPELANVPNKWLFKPWQAPPQVLRDAGITLGDDYPEPIVDLAEGRARALKALEVTKS